MRKDALNYEEYFYITDLGDVYSKSRKVLNNGTYVTKPERKLKPASNGIGYLQVGLYIDGKISRKYVHRLVWEAFNGIIPSGYEINHKDHNKSNNTLSNLEIVTHKENCRLRSKYHKTILSQASSTLDEGAETSGEVKSS